MPLRDPFNIPPPFFSYFPSCARIHYLVFKTMTGNPFDIELKKKTSHTTPLACNGTWKECKQVAAERQWFQFAIIPSSPPCLVSNLKKPTWKLSPPQMKFFAIYFASILRAWRFPCYIYYIEKVTWNAGRRWQARIWFSLRDVRQLTRRSAKAKPIIRLIWSILELDNLMFVSTLFGIPSCLLISRVPLTLIDLSSTEYRKSVNFPLEIII